MYVYICILIIYEYYFSYFHIFWLPQFIRSFLWISFSSRWIPRFLKTALISAVCRIFSPWLFVFYKVSYIPGHAAVFFIKGMLRFLWKFWSRDVFERTMQRWIRPVMWNRRWSVGIILDWDGSKILCTGWLFRFQQAGGPQESTCEEESDFQAKSCESLYQWNQWIIRVFTTCLWFLSFWRGLEFWVLVSWQSWHWWPLFWFGESKC